MGIASSREMRGGDKEKGNHLEQKKDFTRTEQEQNRQPSVDNTEQPAQGTLERLKSIEQAQKKHVF